MCAHRIRECRIRGCRLRCDGMRGRRLGSDDTPEERIEPEGLGRRHRRYDVVDRMRRRPRRRQPWRLVPSKIDAVENSATNATAEIRGREWLACSLVAASRGRLSFPDLSSREGSLRPHGDLGAWR